MRNVKILIGLILLLWLIPQSSLAETWATAPELAPLVVTFGNIKTSPPVQGIIKNDQRYINLPFLYQYLNIVATRDIQKGEIFLQFGKVSIKLYANDPAYYLNGKRTPLALPPFEADDQFWLPLEFLLKLGLTVKESGDDILALDWDQNYLLGMETVQYQNTPAIVFIGSGKLEAIQISDQPGGFCIELANTIKHFSLDEQLKNNSNVTGVRFEPDQNNLKVSFQLNPGLHYNLIPDPKQPNRLLIVFNAPGDTVTPLPQEVESKITISISDQVSSTKETTPPKDSLILVGPLTGKLIVLDPGHGGEDFGACGRQGFLEKDNNLEIALHLKDLLEKAGARVLLTRTDDTYISLYERSYFANDLGADLFISIHTNNHPDLSVHGIEVYSYSGRSVAKTLAQDVLARICQTTGFRTLGAKTEDFVVIRETQMPGILVEVGYLSNYQEEQIMRTPEFKEEAALGIFLGIKDWMKE